MSELLIAFPLELAPLRRTIAQGQAPSAHNEAPPGAPLDPGPAPHLPAAGDNGAAVAEDPTRTGADVPWR